MKRYMIVVFSMLTIATAATAREWIRAVNFITGTLLLATLLSGSAAVAQEGCALPLVRGVTADTVFLGIENFPTGVVAWHVGASDAQRVRFAALPGRLLPSQNGSGPAAWVASSEGNGSVQVFRMSATGTLAHEGSLKPAGVPAAITWTEDGRGHPWIVLATITNGQRRLEAFRQGRSGWRSEGQVPAADLHTPRAVPGRKAAITCGAWRFSDGSAPRRLGVKGNPDLAELYPGRGVLTELRLDDLTVLVSRDAGTHWQAYPAPAPRAEAIDLAGDRPMVRWVAAGRIRVAQFARSRWTTVLDVPVESVAGLSGPAVSISGTLVFVSLCYRTAPGERDCFRVAMIEKGNVRVRTITVY